MNSYAKTVLWLGLFMIVAGIMVNWRVFSQLLFSGTNPALRVPGPGGIPPLKGKNKGNHGCPPGYNYAYGKCWSPAQNPVPSTGGGLV